ncbi:Endomembrane protein 70 [Musa troglodytarum]|uniref:Transmembrane 9 superfamily member n=1 Tax=Musa troglodytarum TaxID=320322 RepID=A0A9E7L5I3_9LILI|nr:Endomembrane protein 70 [Musa troglodytarum]
MPGVGCTFQRSIAVQCLTTSNRGGAKARIGSRCDTPEEGSTSVFIFFYCIHYYHTGSDMSGFMQTSFIFGYMTCICYGFFLMLGTVRFCASLLFMWRIYRAIEYSSMQQTGLMQNDLRESSMIYMNKHTSLLLLQPRDHSPIRRGGIGLHEEVNRLHEVVAITIYVLRRLDQGRIGAGAIGHRGGLQLFRAGIVHWLRGKAG